MAKITIAKITAAILIISCAGPVCAQTACVVNSAYIPAGQYMTGIGEKEFHYIVKLCDMTIGGCYPSWFENEIGRRQVKNRSFCIDRFEYPNREGRYPKESVSYNEAVRLCAASRKRLCTEVEWERACKAGALDNVWSYGRKHNRDACNEDSEGLVPSGLKRECRSVESIFDMNGNVAEWVSDEFVTEIGGKMTVYRILKGGSYRDKPIFTRCSYLDLRKGNQGYEGFGFRCCSEILTTRGYGGPSGGAGTAGRE